MNLKQAAWFSALPWATMAVSGYFAGSASDFLIRTGHSVTSVRKIMQVIIKSAICYNFQHSNRMSRPLLSVYRIYGSGVVSAMPQLRKITFLRSDSHDRCIELEFL